MADIDLMPDVLAHLRALVSFDTRNPPRLFDEAGIFAYVRAQLPDFDIEVRDLGAGAVYLYAKRGAPAVLFNVHLDTVPDSPAWSQDPFVLTVGEDRAVGLGACDIKGAAAALIAASRAVKGWPSCQRTSFRRWKVKVSSSSEISSDSARSGTMLRFLSIFIRPL